MMKIWALHLLQAFPSGIAICPLPSRPSAGLEHQSGKRGSKLDPYRGKIKEFTGSTKEETHKVSRDCYVSWNGNRYSVPWIYTGRETLVSEKFTLKIQVDSQIIAEHDILPGTGRISSRSIVGLYPSICRSCRHGCGSRCTNCYWSGNRFRWSNSHFLD